MRRTLTVLALAGMLAAPWAGRACAQPPEVVPESLREAFRRASPEARYGAFEMLRTKYPELRLEVFRHLESTYPGFSTRLARVARSLRKDYPGLTWSLPRHLLAELDSEPAVVLADVLEAALERYPDLFQRLRKIRREHSPTLATLEFLGTRYPGFTRDLLETLRREHPGALLRVQNRVGQVLLEKHPDLRLDLALEISRLVGEKYPELPAEMREARRRGTRPLAWLAENRPRFLVDALKRIAAKGVLRQFLVDVLADLEKAVPDLPGQVAESVLRQVESRYPDLPGQLYEVRVKARRALRERVAAELPDLGPIVARTLAEKHPGLLEQVRRIVESHYPTLVADLRNALEAEFPGFHREVRSFLERRYPRLFQDLESALS